MREELSGITVVSSVGPADGGRVDTGLTRSSKTVSAGTSRRRHSTHSEPGERLEVKSKGGHYNDWSLVNNQRKHFRSFQHSPQLTDIVRDFVDGEDTCSPSGGGVGAGVARVPDVRGVGGDGGPAGGGGDDAAHSEARGTSAGGRPASAAALGGGVAGPVGGGGAGADTLVIGELDHAEQGELLYRDRLC